MRSGAKEAISEIPPSPAWAFPEDFHHDALTDQSYLHPSGDIRLVAHERALSMHEIGALAIGTLAIGTLAIGTLAIGTLAIGALHHLQKDLPEEYWPAENYQWKKFQPKKSGVLINTLAIMEPSENIWFEGARALPILKIDQRPSGGDQMINGKSKDESTFSIDEISKMTQETKKSISEKLGKIIEKILDDPKS